jgi:hypothetical protein
MGPLRHLSGCVIIEYRVEMYKITSQLTITTLSNNSVHTITTPELLHSQFLTSYYMFRYSFDQIRLNNTAQKGKILQSGEGARMARCTVVA